MPATAQDIMDRAAQRASLNDTSLLDTTKVLKFISGFQKRLFLRAAQIDPDYFGKDGVTATRTAYTDSWDLTSTPGDIAAVTRVEVSTIAGTVSGISVGDQLNLISYRWPDIEVSPRVYLRGKRLTGYKTELGAADANMVNACKVFYAEMPTDLTALGQTLRTPEEWSDLLVLPLARIFSIRDRRLDEVPLLDQEYGLVMRNFETAVLAFGHGVKRPLVSVPAVPLGTGK